MQSLGLSDSVPRSEGRLKALLWPSIQNDTDLDYVTEQGFWVCCVTGIGSLLVSLAVGHPLFGLFEAGFYFLAGTGVRQKSTAAAVMAFLAYLLRIIGGLRFAHANPSIVSFIFFLLLLSTVRGTWLAARWPKQAEDFAVPIALQRTFFEKLSDQVPARVWPVGRWLFYALALLELIVYALVLTLPRSVFINHRG